jgi:hypothetical protein
LLLSSWLSGEEHFMIKSEIFWLRHFKNLRLWQYTWQNDLFFDICDFIIEVFSLEKNLGIWKHTSVNKGLYRCFQLKMIYVSDNKIRDRGLFDEEWIGNWMLQVVNGSW